MKRNNLHNIMKTFALFSATALTISVASAQTVNLVQNGNFANGLAGWSSTSLNVTDNNAPAGAPGWVSRPGLESNASNLAYSGLVTGLTPSAAQGATDNKNDYAVITDFDSLQQNVSGLASASAANSGDLSIWFDARWTNAFGDADAAYLDVIVGGTRYAQFSTSTDTLTTGASFSTINGATLDTGILGTGSTFATSWSDGTWGRFNLVIANYAGTDAPTALDFQMSTALPDGVSDYTRDDLYIDNVIIATVPEPSSTLFLLTACSTLLFRRRRV